MKINLLRVSQEDEVALPFRIPYLVLTGKTPTKYRLYFAAILVGFVGYLIVASYILHAIVGPFPKESIHNLWYAAILLVGGGIGKAVADHIYSTSSHKKRCHQQRLARDYAKDTLVPFLEQHGVKDATRAAADLLQDKRHYRFPEGEENAWGAFALELTVYGFLLRKQYIRIFRWAAPEDQDQVRVITH